MTVTASPMLALALAAALSQPIERGRVVDGIACALDATQTYAVYLPSTYVPSNRRPLPFVFDPRRRGAMAAERFRAAAERYGGIIVAPNDTRSGDGDEAAHAGA